MSEEWQPKTEEEGDAYTLGYSEGLAAGIAQERERCARVAEAEEQECETMRSAYANDAYNWSFWERSRKTASSIAVAIRAGDASE